MRITPATVKHEPFKLEVDNYLVSNGFVIGSAAYHEVMSAELVNVLQRVYTTAGIYYRTRADNIAVREADGFVFEYDAKTHVNKKYDDLTIEVAPLIAHIGAYKHGAMCAYVFRVNGFDGFFWSHNCPPIREIHIPRNTRYTNIEVVKENCREYFPGVTIKENTRSGGSGDPYVIIDKREVQRCNHWKNIIRMQ